MSESIAGGTIMHAGESEHCSRIKNEEVLASMYNAEEGTGLLKRLLKPDEIPATA